MKAKTFQPTFPKFCMGVVPVWVGYGDKLLSPKCIASIPLFSFEEKGSKERDEAEKKYWEQKEKEYQHIKDIYLKYCFVGTIFSGGKSTSSVKITKIVIKENEAYVCYNASEEHIKWTNEQNIKIKMELKPIKAGRFGLVAFLSAIHQGILKVHFIPKQDNLK